jgi:hypothetical protein
MKLANIVSTDKIKVSEDFNVVKSMDDIIHGLPTLVIGYYYCKKTFPEFNITETKIKENIYWTFRKTEKRDKHEEDLYCFISKIYEDLASDISYVFFDPIQQKQKTLRKILKKLYTLKHPITYVHGEIVYIYGEKIVFGIDLNLLKYMSFDICKIKDKIKSKSSVFLGDNKILIEYKKDVGKLADKARYIPYIYSIRNG